MASVSFDVIGVVTVVRDLRAAAGLTQDELATRSGVAQPNIAAYETGQRTPSAAMLNRLRSAAKPRPSVVLAEHRHATTGSTTASWTPTTRRSCVPSSTGSSRRSGTRSAMRP